MPTLARVVAERNCGRKGDGHPTAELPRRSVLGWRLGWARTAPPQRTALIHTARERCVAVGARSQTPRAVLQPLQNRALGVEEEATAADQRGAGVG